MVKVKKIEDFQAFVECVKSKQLAYQIIGSENHAFYGVVSSNGSTQPNHFVFTYVLLSQLGTVYISESVRLKEEPSIKEIASNFNLLSFKKVQIVNGQVECSNQ